MEGFVPGEERLRHAERNLKKENNSGCVQETFHRSPAETRAVVEANKQINKQGKPKREHPNLTRHLAIQHPPSRHFLSNAAVRDLVKSR